jgi:hypothetical protein
VALGGREGVVVAGGGVAADRLHAAAGLLRPGVNICVSIGINGKKLAKNWQKIGKKLAKNWQKIGEKMAKNWQKIGKKKSERPFQRQAISKVKGRFKCHRPL